MKTYHPKCWQACEGILELTDTAYGNSNCTVVHFLEDKCRTTMYDSALTRQGIFFKRKEIMGPHEELSTNVQSNLFVMVQDMEQLVSLSINRRLHIHAVLYTHILDSTQRKTNKKTQLYVCYNIDKSQNAYYD